MHDIDSLLDTIVRDVRPLTRHGRVAHYIPKLADVPRGRLGIAVATIDGQLHKAGDADIPFSMQSVSKVHALALALQRHDDALWARVGREPSGSGFNALAHLELECGMPRNPFVNAGALVLTDVLMGAYDDVRAAVLGFVRRRACRDDIHEDLDVAASELAHDARNTALVHVMRSFGTLQHNADAVLQAYVHQCAIAMRCTDIARSLLFLANRGICPYTGEHVLTPLQTRQVNALCMTCGTYDAAGDTAWRIGLPVKSGVGGGIVAIVPGRMVAAAWSPALNATGTSVAACAALERLSGEMGLSLL